jgi:hypothetical protein
MGCFGDWGRGHDLDNDGFHEILGVAICLMIFRQHWTFYVVCLAYISNSFHIDFMDFMTFKILILFDVK